MVFPAGAYNQRFQQEGIPTGLTSRQARDFGSGLYRGVTSLGAGAIGDLFDMFPTQANPLMESAPRNPLAAVFGMPYDVQPAIAPFLQDRTYNTEEAAQALTNLGVIPQPTGSMEEQTGERLGLLPYLAGPKAIPDVLDLAIGLGARGVRGVGAGMRGLGNVLEQPSMFEQASDALLSGAIAADPRMNVLMAQQGLLAPSRADAIPFEDKMFVQHNLTAENLLNADKIGGLPYPSLAVSKTSSPLSGFGDIKLMFDPSVLKGTPVSKGDAYSVRYPRGLIKQDFANRSIFDNRVAEAREGLGYKGYNINRGKKNERRQYYSNQNIEEHMKHRSFEDAAVDDPSILLTYLQDKGYKLDEIKEYFFLVDRFGVPRFFNKNTRDELDSIFNPTAEVTAAKIAEGTMEDRSRELTAYLRRFGESKNLDFADDWDDWLSNFAQEIGVRDRIQVGERNGYPIYKPATAKNIANVMKKNFDEGEGFTSAGSFRAAVSPAMRNISQVKKERSRLNPIEYRKQKEELADRLTELKYELVELDLGSLKDHSKFAESQIVQQKLERIGRGATWESQFDFEIPSHVKQRTQNLMGDYAALPTEYFEAKPRKVVPLDEAVSAIVPDTTSQKVLDVLEKNNIIVQRAPRDYDRTVADTAVDVLKKQKFPPNTFFAVPPTIVGGQLLSGEQEQQNALSPSL